MPAPEVTYRFQKAVYWALIGRDNYNEPLVAAPVEVMVRWNTRRTEALDAQGNKIALDATVIVGEQVPLGSTFWLGELSEWYGTGSLGSDDEVMTAVTYSETPDLKNRVVRREIGLKRFKDQPPVLN